MVLRQRTEGRVRCTPLNREPLYDRSITETVIVNCEIQVSTVFTHFLSVELT